MLCRHAVVIRIEKNVPVAEKKSQRGEMRFILECKSNFASTIREKHSKKGVTGGSFASGVLIISSEKTWACIDGELLLIFPEKREFCESSNF